MVASQVQVNNSRVVQFESLTNNFESLVSEEVLAEIHVSERETVLEDFGHDVHASIAKSDVLQVKLASVCRLVVLDHDVEEADHLLLASINLQVLALGNVELQ